MSDSDFISEGDDEFLVLMDNLLTNLKPDELGVSESELADLKALRDDFQAKVDIAKKAEAIAAQARSEIFQVDWGEPRH